MSHETHHDPEETVVVESPPGLAYLQSLLAVLFLGNVALLSLARALPEWRGPYLTLGIWGAVIFLLALPKALRFPGLPLPEKTVSVVLVLLSAVTAIYGIGTLI